MNASMPEEAAQTTRSLIEAFKQNPGMLALVVFNVFFVVVVFYVSQQNRASNEKLISIFLSQQAEVTKLLYNCTPGPPRG